LLQADRYIVIHVSRHAGTSIEEYLLKVDPSISRISEKHDRRKQNPSSLPTIGFIRNPLDWYTSAYTHYKKVGHPLYEIIGGDFEAFTSTLLKMPLEVSEELSMLDWNATYPRRHSGLNSSMFSTYDSKIGYYTWLWRNALEGSTSTEVHIILVDANLKYSLDTVLNTLEVYTVAEPLEILNSSGDLVYKYSNSLIDKILEQDSYLFDKISSIGEANGHSNSIL